MADPVVKPSNVGGVNYMLMDAYTVMFCDCNRSLSRAGTEMLLTTDNHVRCSDEFSNRLLSLVVASWQSWVTSAVRFIRPSSSTYTCSTFGRVCYSKIGLRFIHTPSIIDEIRHRIDASVQ